MATDLEVRIHREIRTIPVEEEGEVLLPASRTLAILREPPDEQLVIETGPQTKTVRGGSAEFGLGSENPATFPDIPSVNGDGYHEISGGTLKIIIRCTLFAAATESHRHSLTGTLWELKGTTARLVATDGCRIPVVEGAVTAQGDHSTKGTHVVPAKAMDLLERNVNDPDEQLRVTIRPNKAHFQTGQATIYTTSYGRRRPNGLPRGRLMGETIGSHLEQERPA